MPPPYAQHIITDSATAMPPHEKLPNVRGARSAAKYGYGRGLSAHNKVNKYQAKAGRK